MNRDRDELEHELARHLQETAPAPEADALARATARLEAFPQRAGWRVRVAAALASPRWPRAGAMAAVAAAALVIGIFIGQVGLPFEVEPSSSPSASTDSSPVESGRPGRSADASPGPATAMSYAVWERIDLPDPAPGVFGGGTPRSVVAFGNGYVAVGTVFTECCAEADPAANRGVVWTSADGRTWALLDVGAVFDHATLNQVVTDGTRLVASGSYAEPDGLGFSVAAAWVSTDGLTWQRASDPAPSTAVATADGFVGVARQSIRRLGLDSVRLLRTTDGLTWTETRSGDDPVRAVQLVAGPGGGAWLVAMHPGEERADGTPTEDIVVWRTEDGRSWDGPDVVLRGVWVSGGATWQGQRVLVGYRDVPGEGALGMAWLSSDGLSWQEQEIGAADDETLTGVFAVGEALVAVGDTTTASALTDIMAWVSEDGVNWRRVTDQPAFAGVNNTVTSAISTSGGLLAVGRRWDPESGHPVPQAWLSSSEPMVWLEASSTSGAEIGARYDFQFGHCSLQSPIDFDGSLWVLGGSDYVLPPVPLDQLEGTIRLTGTDTAVFEDSASNWALLLARHDGALAYPLCD